MKKKLELWRAMTALDGYICCVQSKRRNVVRLLKQLINFRDQPPGPERKSTSMMIVAHPGSGKNQLVDCLAHSAGLRMLPFDISQMTSKSEILDCFDTIVTTASQQPVGDKGLLVFFDEINAPIQGHTVFETFLGPLERSEYVRSGKTFRMLPCAWLFAGTARPSECQIGGTLAPKASDFESRLTIEPLTFVPISAPESHLENVYLGASIIRKTFPDTKYVTERVLRAFRQMPHSAAAREIRQFVRSFRNVQFAEVNSRNIPDFSAEEFSDLGLDAWRAEERNKTEGDLIELCS